MSNEDSDSDDANERNVQEFSWDLELSDEKADKEPTADTDRKKERIDPDMNETDNAETSKTEEDRDRTKNEESENSTDSLDNQLGVESERETDESDSQSEETDESTEEMIPEMYDDVYRRPLQGYDVTNPSELAEAVGEIDMEAMMTIEELARERETLAARVERLNREITSKEEEIQTIRDRKNNRINQLKETASAELIKRIIPIRDDFERAIVQDETDIEEGVKMIRKRFDKILESEGVEIINPERGDELDPDTHEVMATVKSDVQDNHVYDCFRPGYKIGEQIIQPARVTTSEYTENQNGENDDEAENPPSNE